MINYLFIFTIGPVQSFIAQARKAQDLYAGSRILSKLVQHSIQQFNEKMNTDGINTKIIFPGKWEGENVSLPSRFIGKIISDGVEINANEIKRKGTELRIAVEAEFKNIAIESLGDYYSNEVDNQIKRHLDIHWAALPIKSNYKTAHRELEHLLGAVKNVRRFSQIASGSGEMGRKCTLDGENNSLFYHADNGKTPALLRFNRGTTLINDFILNPGEAISGVSFVKRKYLEAKRELFPSVAEIALLTAVQSIKGKKGEEYLKDLKKLCGGKNEFISHCIRNGETLNLDTQDIEKLNSNFDYQLVYPENVTAKNFPIEEQRKHAIKISEKLSSKLKDKHYALIMFDGDNMGEWLSGKNTDHNGEELEGFHTDLSKNLSAFATSVNTILDKSKGKVIYTGGDDFLGMVNLHYLFNVMREMRLVFHEKVNSQIKLKKRGKELTFSAGIVISHYKTPLSEVMNKVREMEQKAKKGGDRNAFALAVIKHSGEIQEAVFKWDLVPTSPNSCSNWDAIETVFKNLYENIFSNKFITNLTLELYQLAGFELEEILELDSNAFKVEIARLLKKSLIDKATDQTVLESMSKALSSLFQSQQEHKQIRNFIHSLHIADFMQRRMQKNVEHET